MRCRAVLGMVLFLCLCAGTGRAQAQMFVSTGRQTLRGLPGVELQVEPLQPELEGNGLTAVAIRRDVEDRLRARGVTVYPSQTANPSPAKAYLYVRVNALTLPRGGGYAIAVQLHLRQTLRSLVTESNIVDAMTWETQNILGAQASELPGVRDEVLAYVDRFVEDWAAVH